MSSSVSPSTPQAPASAIVHSSSTYDLVRWGWSPDIAAAWPSVPGAGLLPGRVVTVHRTMWEVVHRDGMVQCSLAGCLLRESPAERPAVGDWVGLHRLDGSLACIEAILPRRTCLRRVAPGGSGTEQVIAANVDTVFIVGGLDGDHEPRRLRRYLALVRGGGAQAVLVLNKADRCPDPTPAAAAAVARIADGAPIHILSAVQGTGVAELLPYLQPRRTLALLGSSGVGKSTILNALLGAQVQYTGAVRESDDRGQHTTTRRDLLPHPSGAVIMDTPGMRELALSTGAADLDGAFVELELIARGCRFGDCRHQGEPGCAVLPAVAGGHLQPEDLAEWRKLHEEADRDQRRQQARQGGGPPLSRQAKRARRRQERREWR